LITGRVFDAVFVPVNGGLPVSLFYVTAGAQKLGYIKQIAVCRGERSIITVQIVKIEANSFSKVEVYNAFEVDKTTAGGLFCADTNGARGGGEKGGKTVIKGWGTDIFHIFVEHNNNL